MKTIAIDFDGVVHSYRAVWMGADIIPDLPVDGAFEALREYIKHFDVVIHSTRARYPEGIESMMAWFIRHGWPADSNGAPQSLSFEAAKPKAHLTIDDRCICFRGTFPGVDDIKDFKTWQHRGE